MAGYAGGRIKRIKIRNFMTYDDVEILPKDGLNLIVGLNGSGKSSIMCAICLGLAGKPQFTGRASTLSDFIKHGEHQAEIEIELENIRGNNVVINRKIKGGEKCEWHLNKRLANQNEVIATVKKFNIDTSNLCQFLPQEKVVEFSRMDKKQRLENMLQAIGEPHLFELFTELKELRKKCLDIETSIKKSQQTKSTDEEKNDRISGEVQKQESRVRLKKELDDLFNKRILLQYKELQSEFTEIRKQKKNLERELAVLCQKRDAAVVGEDGIIKEYRKHSAELDALKSKKTDVCSEITRNSTCLMKYNEQVHSAKIEYKNRMMEKENQKKRLQDINVQIDSMEKSLQEEKKKHAIREEKMQLNTQQILKVEAEISNLQRELEKASAEKNSHNFSVQRQKQQLAVLKDEHNKKMSNLRKWDKYTYEAVCWLNENKGTFRSRVYQPIMLEIKVHSAENCKYVENHIAIRDMLAFVCEDKEDCKRLTDILKNQKKLPVNIVMAPDTPLSNFSSPILTKDLRSYGLECFLIDLFSAPEPVMRYLCSCYHMHNIPVAKSAVEGRQIETILQKFRVFFSANTKISGKRSRYGDHNWSVKKDFISERKWLVNFDDEQQKEIEGNLQDLERKLHSAIKACDNLTMILNEKDKIENQLRNERRNLMSDQKNIPRLITQLQQRKSIREQMSIAIVKEREASKVSEKVQFINQEREKIFNHLNELFKKYNSVQKEIIQHTIYMNCFSKELKLMRAANEEIHDKVKEAEEKVSGAKKLLQEKKGPATKLLEEVKKIKIDSVAAYNMETLEETEEKINHIQAQLDLNEDNEPLIREYNDRKRKIAAILTDIKKYENKLENMKKSIQEKKKEWLKPLQHHISNINKKFSAYFKYLLCAGEINLDVPENSEDFSCYGLQIKLKFHNDEPLTELSQTHHSGGECSVAAIVFILSLQELTEVPFRCIDEINQGMDSINERKIYQLIADSVGDDRCSQYFLLTPKLLMDLQYPEDVAVHIIYNSCFLNITLDVKKHIQIAQSA